MCWLKATSVPLLSEQCPVRECFDGFVPMHARRHGESIFFLISLEVVRTRHVIRVLVSAAGSSPASRMLCRHIVRERGNHRNCVSHFRFCAETSHLFHHRIIRYSAMGSVPEFWANSYGSCALPAQSKAAHTGPNHGSADLRLAVLALTFT